MKRITSLADASAVLEKYWPSKKALLFRPEPILVVAGSFYLLNAIRPQLQTRESSNVPQA